MADTLSPKEFVLSLEAETKKAFGPRAVAVSYGGKSINIHQTARMKQTGTRSFRLAAAFKAADEGLTLTITDFSDANFGRMAQIFKQQTQSGEETVDYGLHRFWIERPTAALSAKIAQALGEIILAK